MTFRLLQKMMLKEEMAILGGMRHCSSARRHAVLSARGRAGRCRRHLLCENRRMTLEAIRIRASPAGSRRQSRSPARTATRIRSAAGVEYSAPRRARRESGRRCFCTATACRARSPMRGMSDGDRGRDAAGDHVDQLGRLSAPLASGSRRNRGQRRQFGEPSYAYDGLLTSAFKSGSNATSRRRRPAPPERNAADRVGARLGGRDRQLSRRCGTISSSARRAVRQCAGAEEHQPTSAVERIGAALAVRGEHGRNAYDLAAAGAVSFYFNPFALNGGLRIPIRIHPRVPQHDRRWPRTCRSSTSRARCPTSPRSRRGRITTRSTGRW